MLKRLVIGALLLASNEAAAEAVPMREQARVVNEILDDRLTTLLPELMRRADIDMWVVISREYNEDPVLRTMLPAEWLNARRRTILLFYRDPSTGKTERLSIARYGMGKSIRAAWDPKVIPDQWEALIAEIVARDPRKIAVNLSADFAHADGLDHTDYQTFLDRLPVALKGRVVSAEPLAVSWLETRTEREMRLYPALVAATHRIIEEGFSEKVITPGVTTADDVVWWFREKIRAEGYETWFHPSVEIQRAEGEAGTLEGDTVIRPGDLLHVDIGITCFRLNTDIQQHAYVLKPGETVPPAGLVTAFHRANRVQDILTAEFKEGRTGNRILAAALAAANKEGLRPLVYTHPIGFHGHAAGPAIGLWDMQGSVPGSGDVPMHRDTAYSIELSATTAVPEWKKDVRVMLEEDGFFGANGFRYIDRRQRAMLTIPRGAAHLGQ